MKGRQVHVHSPADIIKEGVALVTEDRKVTGLNLSGTVNDNIANDQLLINELLGESGETKADQTPAVPGEDATETGNVPTMTEAELAAAKAEAEQKMSARRELLEENIRALVADRDALLADFDAMVTVYNREKINELTVTVTKYDYWTPRLLSGAFIKKAIQTAGPIVALGFIACMALIVISRRKEEKRAFKA